MANQVAEFSNKDVNADAITKSMKNIGISTKQNLLEHYFTDKMKYLLSFLKLFEIPYAKRYYKYHGSFAKLKNSNEMLKFQFQIKGAGKTCSFNNSKRVLVVVSIRAARIDNRYMGLDVEVETVGMFVQS